MSDFRMIINADDFHKQEEMFWNNNVAPEEGDFRPSSKPIGLPFLAAWRVGRDENAPRLLRIICNKKDAKRLVYSKTNRGRASNYIFAYFSGDIESKIINYASRQMQYANVDPGSPAQREHIHRINAKVKDMDGPVLVASYTCLDHVGVRTIRLFIVTKSDAHKLVYYSKYIGINEKAFEFANMDTRIVYSEKFVYDALDS